MTNSSTGTVDSTPQKTALVVASGGDIDELLTSVLAIEGWNIQRAVDNQDALSLARTKPFDLIITGRKTRGPEDLELLRLVRGARPHYCSRAHVGLFRELDESPHRRVEFPIRRRR